MLPGLLADENIPMPVIEVLRVAGHDVLSIRESAPGSPDQAVLRLAVAILSLLADPGSVVGSMVIVSRQGIRQRRFRREPH